MEHEQAERILAAMRQLTTEGRFRNFAAQAHSRAVLQRLGVDPVQWPNYTPTLDENLLYTAHLLFWQGLQLRELPDFRPDGDELIKQGAEILEFLYSEAVDTQAPVERIDQLVNAALGYYIAGHYARAYVLAKDLESEDLPQELGLLHRLFLKNLAGLRDLIYQVLDDDSYTDAVVAAALHQGAITEDEALDRILRASIARAFSYFVEFPKTGRRSLLDRARGILDEGIELTEKVKFVSWWWLFYCARYLFDEFDTNSLWTQLGPLQGDDPEGNLVDPYIRAGYRRHPRVVELWRSQTAALPQVNEVERRSYCLKMPTSAGKTRVAELVILRFLLDYQDDSQTKCIYIAPFRSLAVEIEASLRQSFHPLGVRVSELYGGFELSPIERMLMDRTRIIIATPEKIDAFLRYNPDLADQVRLVIIDEGHIISPTERGIRFEFFLHRLIIRYANQSVRFFFLSAVLPNIDQFASWITGSPDNFIESEWRPSRLMLGELSWNGRFARIDYTHLGYRRLEHECFVSSFIQPLRGEQLRGTRRQNPFPNDMPEVVADAALRFAQQDMTLVFIAQRRSVEPFGQRLLKALKIKKIVAKRNGEEFNLPIAPEGRALYDECLTIAEETMGSDAEIVKFLKAGFVVHHSKLPQKLRIKLEQLIRHQVVRLVVATTTLAQGVNLPIRTVIVHSLMLDHNKPISPLDFWNICGRAGRGMKENEGQILFAVDLTEDAWQRAQDTQFRQKMVEGYQIHKLLSALRQLLYYIIQQWRHTHPVVNVAVLCQLLAENNIDWIPPENRKGTLAWLDFLDSQLIALTEEQVNEEITPDDLQNLMQRSLLILQLEAQPQGELTAELARDLLYARLESIRRRFPTRRQRHRFYRLGFPISDCERVDDHRDNLLNQILAAQDYYDWNPDIRCEYLISLLEFLFELDQLRPDASSLPTELKNGWRKLADLLGLETWQQLDEWQMLWRVVLKLWLQGYTAQEMAHERAVKQSIDSPADISVLIDDLFGYRAPWGLNALVAYLQEFVTETDEEIPRVVSYFAALLKYGVHSPAASSLLAFGLNSRKIALKMAEQCLDEAMEPEELLIWFVRLTEQELAVMGFTDEEIETIAKAQQEASSLAQMTGRRRTSQTVSIQLLGQALDDLQEGDTLVLRARSDLGNSHFTLYTLWGDSLGTFEAPNGIPKIWSAPDQIDVTVAAINHDSANSLLTLAIEPV
ncbi:MAG: hypothetical protein BroJett011_18260 [Chloroflexota bacterium]|nr:MAG: hypothetical protein BroJett011_18260 [Chloroflexota bacterium]